MTTFKVKSLTLHLTEQRSNNCFFFIFRESEGFNGLKKRLKAKFES